MTLIHFFSKKKLTCQIKKHTPKTIAKVIVNDFSFSCICFEISSELNCNRIFKILILVLHKSFYAVFLEQIKSSFEFFCFLGMLFDFLLTNMAGISVAYFDNIAWNLNKYLKNQGFFIFSSKALFWLFLVLF